MAMRITYDKQADAAFIYLVPLIGDGEVTRTDPCDVAANGASIILAFDRAKMLIGIEVLGASRILRPQTLSNAQSETP